eukprot:scaffold1131_cov88-Skeletonema_marinoi.AAC.2
MGSPPLLSRLLRIGCVVLILIPVEVLGRRGVPSYTPPSHPISQPSLHSTIISPFSPSPTIDYSASCGASISACFNNPKQDALGIAKKNHMTQFIYRNLKLLRLGIIVVDEDNLIVRKGEEEIYMMFEATPSSSCMDIRLAHRGMHSFHVIILYYPDLPKNEYNCNSKEDLFDLACGCRGSIVIYVGQVDAFCSILDTRLNKSKTPQPPSHSTHHPTTQSVT